MFVHNRMIDRFKLFALMAVLVLFGGAGNAWAICNSPTGDEGSIIYNADFKVAQFCNGTNWISMADTGVMTDTLAGLSCTIDQIASWNGSAWVCAAAPTNILGDLTCTAGQIPSWSGTNWVCADDSAGTNGGGGAVGDNSIYNLTFTAGTPGTPGSSGETVDDVFSTDLYTGNGGAQTITNGLDLSGEGGLVWLKSRSHGNQHYLWDSERGAVNYLLTDSTSGQNSNGATTGLTLQNDGFAITTNAFNAINASSRTYAAWTFRESPKFFDIVTYTGDGVAGRTVTHDLGIDPGMIIVKRTDSSDNWWVYHRSAGGTVFGTTQAGEIFFQLEGTMAANDNIGWWNNTDATSTEFTLGSSATNTSGGSYVAYLFAHDDSVDGVIQCGSAPGNGTAVNLGWEPQFVMIKAATNAGSWHMFDDERGMNAGNDARLFVNSSVAEDNGYNPLTTSGTGFTFNPSHLQGSATSGDTFIYCAIRATGGALTAASAGTPGTNGTIVDSDGLGTLSSLIVAGDSFSISGSASNDRVFTAADVPDANTIEVPQTLITEGPVSVTITKQGSSGTLAGLVCADGQVMRWDDTNSRWSCDVELGGADNFGDHIARRDIDAAGNKVTSALGVVYSGIGGGQPGQAIGIGGSGNIQAGVKLVATEGAACSDVGKMAKTTGGQLLVCEGSSEITDESCSGFNEGAIAFSSGGTMHLCLD